jgi:hypothetical protein
MAFVDNLREVGYVYLVLGSIIANIAALMIRHHQNPQTTWVDKQCKHRNARDYVVHNICISRLYFLVFSCRQIHCGIIQLYMLV